MGGPVSSRDASVQEWVERMARGRPPGLGALSGSDRLERWAARLGIVRTERRFDEPEVAAWLGARAPSHAPAVVRCEEGFGGLLACAPGHRSDRPHLALGLGLLTTAPEALVTEWLAAEGEFEPTSDPDARVPIVPKGRGVWVFDETPLVLTGEWYERWMLCDRHGVLWRYDTFSREIDVAATRPATLLERLAIDEELFAEMNDAAIGPIRVFAEVAPAVAAALGLERVEVASDAIVQHYRGGSMWLRQLSSYGPQRVELRIITVDCRLAVEAVRVARASAPDAPVRIWSNLDLGRQMVAALSAAGFGRGHELTTCALFSPLS
jgi:hypothetical protein